ncbi:Asp-tRNA(Asn)/Glu-tRNA(Gln) amidotransferase subunit GatC [Saccharospirillum impatiens]|uniref:Asp-tRNA(Asn)/Glu-tRNA(Gln) amidotransferase subunit GatC n=1 Tax=Saccharospirillum impatiens TaxID=169438 RepID=UPI00042125CE|nr:Asp-tRNA(Asn)/Glu-tRNA(Gln) amidotransferase subunit GatC [Saccharospirillum impatiens]
MSLDRSQVENVAQLARLQVSEDAMSETVASLSSILDLADQLQKINTDGVEPLSNPLDATARLRADDVTESNQRDAYQSIAPSATDGLYLVPKVIE